MSIEEFLILLNKNKIEYCVIRGWQNLTNSKEIDILVNQKDIEKIKSIFSVIKSYSGYHVFLLTKDNTIINIHLITQFSWNYSKYLPENEILKNKVKRKYYYIPKKEHYLAILLMHSILEKKKFRRKDIKRINELLDQNLNTKEIESLFSTYLGILGKKLVKKIKEKDFDYLIKLRKQIIYKLIRNKPKSLFLLLKKLIHIKILKIFWIPPLISFVGPDGAGKTTLINYLNKFLISLGFKTRSIGLGYLNTSFFLLRPFDRKKRRGFILYDFFKIIDWWLRYLESFVFRIILKNIILADRYYLDFLYYSNRGLFILLSKFVPRPDITFFIYETPHVLYERRQQFSISELKAHLEKMRNINNKLKKRFHIVWLKNDKLDESLRNIFEITISNKKIRNYLSL